MNVAFEYTAAACGAMTRHFLARVGRLFVGPCFRVTLFCMRDGFLTPCLRLVDGQVSVYENPKLRYPVGVPVVGLAWKKPGRPIVLLFKPGCRTVSFLVDVMRQPPALAEEVTSDESFLYLEQVMAVSIPQRQLVLYVETSLPDGFGKKREKDDSYFLAQADALNDEITAFVNHPSWPPAGA